MKSGKLPPPLGTPLNRSHNLSQGLMGSWLLNEGGGLKAFDSSLNKNHGVLTNTATFVRRQLGSCYAGAYLSSTYINLGTTTNLDLPATMTISAWIQPNNVSAGTRQIVCNSNAGGSLVQWNLELNRTAAKIGMLYNSGGVAITSTTSLVADTWYHVVGSRAGATGAWTYKIYINGRLDATSATANNPNAHQIDCIGAGGNAFQYFNGQIKNVQIWNRALTDNEVTQLYVSPYCMY